MTGFEVAAVLAIAGGGVGAVGAIQQGAAASKAAKFNAAQSEQEASLARGAADFEEARFRETVARLRGSQRATAAGQGTTLEGSPLLVLEETAEDAELEALSIRFAGSVGEARARSRSAIERFEGRQARRGSFFRAGASLLTGASSAASLLRDRPAPAEPGPPGGSSRRR